MADYIFNVYLHTDMVELKSEYSTNLPSFYFTPNEFVSPNANINVVNSYISCAGANVYNAVTTLIGGSEEICIATKSMYNSTLVYMRANSQALVPASSIKYSIVYDIVYLLCYTVPLSDYA